MADNYKQSMRPMSVATPLAMDTLLLVGFEGTEQISGLYSFQLDLLAPKDTKIDFSKLLGGGLVVTLQLEDGNAGSKRYFGGICRQFSQGNRDQDFIAYQAEMVPQLWLTTRNARSRIFQQKSVPDILKEVFSGLKVTYRLDGNFEKRDYCVQYRETDFNFVSRLMEEEGIFYFFKHTESGHELIVGNSARAHEDVPGSKKVRWRNMDSSGSTATHIHEWRKQQQLRSGKFTLWDHCFDRPKDNFESKKNTLGSVAVGTVTHKLQVGGNENFEIYDYPGEFAQRFDGIDKGGGEQPAELGKVSPDGSRTVELRMQAETVAGLVIQGSSNCRSFTTGCKFTLEEHFDANGSYIITSVHHSAHGGNLYRSSGGQPFVYDNRFQCIPQALPYRPQRTTPKPQIAGVQTAIVVGPAGDEIFTDKYGRVKVQFHWDREGSGDANSSCWLRVGTPWAGKQWGAIQIPRIGHEVIVQFLEGDPDAPLIIGSVFNADAMPPYKLPDYKTRSTMKSLSTIGGGGFNEIRFEDKKGEEQIFVHAEHNQDVRVKNDSMEFIGANRHLIVKQDQMEKVFADKHQEVTGNHNQKVGETLSIDTGQNIQEKAGMNIGSEAGQEIHLKAGMNVVIEAGMSITLKAGGGFVVIGPSGVAISGTPVLINSGGSAGSGAGISPTAPQPPKEADNAQPGDKDEAKQSKPTRTKPIYGPMAVVLAQAAQSGTPFCAQCASGK